MDADKTTYSEIIKGDRRNHGRGVRFDMTGDGYLGVTDFEDDRAKDRVLLSPAQVAELVAFAKRRSR